MLSVKIISIVFRFCKNLLAILLWMIIVYLVYSTFIHIKSQPVWGVLDETAHMDYVEKISKGKIKFHTDTPIEPEILESFAYTKWAIPPDFDGSIEKMGLSVFSYELHQPPFYYSIMAIFNFILRALGVDIIQRVYTIRYVSFIFYLFGIFYGFLSLKYLFKKCKSSFSLIISQLYVVFALTVGSFSRFGVSNDWMAVCLINALVYLFLVFYFQNKQSLIPWIHFLIVALLLTKFTYVPLALFFIFTGYLIDKSFLRIRSYVSLYLIVLAWYSFFLYSRFKPSYSHEFFKMILPAGHVDFKNYLLILFDNAFFWIPQIPFILKPGLNILFLFGLSFILLFNKKFLVFHIYTFSILVILFLMMFVLNRWVAGVHWYAYRHYNGYGLFIFWGVLGWLIYLIERFNKLNYTFK